MTVLPEPLSVDACPICHANHWAAADWWGCGKHRHKLQHHHIDPGGRVVYACPAAEGCTVTVFGPTPVPKEPPMTTPAVRQPASDIALREDQDGKWTDKQLAVLGIAKAPNAIRALFFHRCIATGLDPFANQICCVPRGDNWSIQTEIDGYRLIARRAARRDGKNLHYSDVTWYDKNLNEYPAWVKDEPPSAASMTVYVDGAPFPATVSYRSFVQRHPRTGKPMGKWETMPDHMLAVRAESHALRKAFQSDLADIELTDAIPAVAPPAAAAQTWHAAAIQDEEADDAHVKAALALQAQWHRLGIEDTDEWLNLTAALAGTDTILDTIADLDTAEIRRITALLNPKTCHDIGDVHALIDRGDKPGSAS